VTSVGDSFAWPFRDPAWASKFLLQGLILIIPIVGMIAMLGWMMLSLDNLRAGRRELAPAGFHLGRGLALFGVEIVWLTVLYVPFAILFGLGVAAGQQSAALGALLFALANLLEALLSLLLAFLFPAIVQLTYEAGFSGGLNPGSVWRLAAANPANTVLAALVIVAAGVIGGLGVVLFGVGVVFTTAYAGAVIAGAVAWYGSVQRPVTSPTSGL
jgi:hypothetical protein